ncbi:Uncharacterised protein g2670 [Pycnogonum litorale]
MMMVTMQILSAFTVILVLVSPSIGQRNPNLTNYDNKGVEGIVRLSGTGEITSDIVTHRTIAHLSCGSGDMVVTTNFSEPFRGIIYADNNRATPCKVYGDGGRTLTLRMPLMGCGTFQGPPRVFTNTIIVRFHPSLEVEEDEFKTIVCRYPPPIAPPPNNLTIIPPPPIIQAATPQLSEVEILLIISAILFLTLLLLGICCAYYCLKRRNIKIIRKKKAASGMGSEITKLSHTTMPALSAMEQIKIPRAVAQSYYGSEAALLTSTDYPSESPSTMTSDIDEMDMRRTEVSNLRHEHTQFVNNAYSADEDRLSAFPSDKEQDSISFVIPPAVVVAKQDSKLHERFLTTVVEKENVRTEEDVDNIHAIHTQYHIRDDRPALTGHETMATHEQEMYDETEEEIDIPGPPSTYAPSTISPTPSPLTDAQIENELMTETMNVSEFKEDKSFIRYMSLPKAHDGDESAVAIQSAVAIPPKIEIKNIEDTYITKTTDIEESEVITKHSKDTIEYHQKVDEHEEDEDWDVIIRTYPPDTADIGVGPQNSLPSSRAPSLYSERPESVRSGYSERSRRSLSSWDVLIRVIQPPPDEPPLEDMSLTAEDKETLKTIVKTDRIFRSLIQEATTYEELVTISRDVRYRQVFSRETWDVVIRVLSQGLDESPLNVSAPSTVRQPRYKKNEDTRSKRGSLAHLNEANQGSSSRYPYGSVRSRRTSQSNASMRDYDMRSMTEEEVNFAHADRESIWSADSGNTYRTGGHSIAERSTSEFLEDIPMVRGGRPMDGSLRVARPSLERSSSEFVTTADSVAQGVRNERETVSSQQWQGYSAGGQSRRVLERSSTEYLESVPQITLDDMAIERRLPRSRSGSIISASSSNAFHRPPLERSSTEIVINSPIIRAMDLAATSGEREQRSVTESYSYGNRWR